MGPSSGVTVSVSPDDRLWNALADVATSDAQACMGVVAGIVAASAACDRPSALMREVRENGSDLTGPWRDRLEELAEGGTLEPGLIGRSWEVVKTQRERRAQGAHYTPPAVAKEIAEIVVGRYLASPHAGGDTPTIWDPASGGGAFLIAALEALEKHTGLDRASLVSNCYASDIDGFALRICDASLEIWANGAARPNVRLGDALLAEKDLFPESFDLIVGNPPFLGQLTSDTTRSGRRGERLRERYQSVSRAYLDEAGLFLAMASEHLTAHGVLGLILPASLLGAADAIDLRRALQETHSLVDLWIDPTQSFAAAVDVVAVVLERRNDHNEGRLDTSVWLAGTAKDMATPQANTWAPLLAAADDVPRLKLSSSSGVVGDLATLTAGFRQHFYGIADAVAEASEKREHDVHPALVTSGSIDPLHNRWGARETRFAGERWQAPVLHLDRITDEAVRDWFAQRLRPKLLLASQTPIVEVVVDVDATMVPSVPVLVVEPEDHDQLWLLAAVLASPVASAWLYLRAAGTGLSRRAMRVRASEVAEIPLPMNRTAWIQGAEAAQRAQSASESGDLDGYIDALAMVGKTMNNAYEADDAVGQWWWKRHDKRTLGRDRAY